MDARSSGGSGGDSRHRRLCHEICSGERANDAGAWREALQCSLTSSSLAAAKEIVDIGEDIIGVMFFFIQIAQQCCVVNDTLLFLTY